MKDEYEHDREWRHMEMLAKQRDKVTVGIKTDKDCSLVGAIINHLKETEVKDDE